MVQVCTLPVLLSSFICTGRFILTAQEIYLMTQMISWAFCAI